MQHVLVTGANGHVGSVLTEMLVAGGYRVRAGVRDPRDPAKTRHLAPLGVELVRVELLDRPTVRAAVAGVDGIFHIASALKMWAPDPQREIIDPTVQGAVAVMEEARAGGVGKVVLTSSIGAVGLDAQPERPLTEADWNTTPGLPYIRAKVEAERAAWRIAEAGGPKLLTILPGMILGPGFHRLTPSTWIIDAIVKRKFPGVPPIGSGFVDVRDVARAHLLAYEKPAAAGRYLAVTGPYVKMLDLARMVAAAYPELKIPLRELPRWTLPIGVFFDWLGNRLLGRPRQITRDMLVEFTDRYVCYDPAKTRRDLGWEPMPLEQTVRDTVEWIRGLGPGA